MAGVVWSAVASLSYPFPFPTPTTTTAADAAVRHDVRGVFVQAPAAQARARGPRRRDGRVGGDGRVGVDYVVGGTRDDTKKNQKSERAKMEKKQTNEGASR